MYPYFEIGNIQIQSYYLLAILAGMMGCLWCFFNFKKTETMVVSLILTVLTVVVALVGARFLNILINKEAYPTLASMFELSYKKLSLMGGLIFGILPTVVYAKAKHKNALKMLDGMIYPVGFAIMLLKTGCFLNGCCFGKETDCLFGMVFPTSESVYAYSQQLGLVGEGIHKVHPTQLYELIGTGLVLLVIGILQRVITHADGFRFGLFVTLFSAVRLTVLPFRQLPYAVNVEQFIYPILYLILIIIGVWIFIKSIIKA